MYATILQTYSRSFEALLPYNADYQVQVVCQHTSRDIWVFTFYSEGNFHAVLNLNIEKPVSLHLSSLAGCSIEFITAKDRILTFRHEDGPISHLAHFISVFNSEDCLVKLIDICWSFEIHYGLGSESPTIDLLNVPSAPSHLNVNSERTAHSTGNVTVLEINNPLVRNLNGRLKDGKVTILFGLNRITTEASDAFKAVSCPMNIGNRHFAIEF